MHKNKDIYTMQSYKITEELLSIAQQRLNITPIFDGSHRGMDANQVGVIGELIVEQWLEENAIYFKDERELTTHDYSLKNSKTFDVKTKDRTVRPQSNYDCSVPMYNHGHQRPDYYIFVSLERDKSNKTSDLSRFHTAHIVGGINILQLDKRGTIWKAGQTDPDNGTTFWTDCINVSVKQLANPLEVLDKLRLDSPAVMSPTL